MFYRPSTFYAQGVLLLLVSAHTKLATLNYYKQGGIQEVQGMDK